MANLLSLVDRLIGSILQGNVFTDIDTFRPSVPARPTGADNGIPNTDLRLLRFAGPNSHPHAGLTGPGDESNAGTHVIPNNPSHDNVGDFLTPSRVAGIIARQTPGGKRGEIYAGSKFTPGGRELHPDVGDQITQVSEPLNSVVPRASIYQSSDSGNRIGGPLSDLLAFHESKIHPHVGPTSQIPNPETALPSAQSQPLFSRNRPDGYEPSQHGVPSTSAPTPGNYETGQTELREWRNIDGPKRDELYTKTPNFVEIPPDVISQKDITTDLGQNATQHPINTLPEFTKDPAEAYDPTRRDDIYTLAEGDQIRSNVAGTQLSRPTVGDQLAAQSQRPPTLNFQGGDANDAPVPGGDFAVVANPDRPQVLERSFGGDAPLGADRDDLASKHHAQRLSSTAAELRDYNNALNVERPHGLVDKVATTDGYRGGQVYAGGYTAVQGAGSEKLRYLDVIAAAKWFENIRKEIGAIIPGATVKGQQDDRNNLQSSTEGVVKSIAWPVSQLLLASLNPTDLAGYGSLNAVWNPLSFAASIVPGLRSTPAANITLGAVAAGTGFGGYKQNVNNSVAISDPSGIVSSVGGERLLQMRKGTYIKSIDGNQLSQLDLPNVGFLGELSKPGEYDTLQSPGALFPISIETQVDEGVFLDPEKSNKFTIKDSFSVDPPSNKDQETLIRARKGILEPQGLLGSFGNPAFKGELNKPGKINTLDRLSFVDDLSVEDQVDTDVAASVGIHGNLYNSNTPYGADTAIFPIERMISEAVDFGDENPQVTKLADMFIAKSWPGASSEGITPYTFVADPVGSRDGMNLVDAPGLNAATTDVGFTPEDFEAGVIAEVIPEDGIYMPFMFQDLRDKTDQFLYFRAFLKDGISETFTPDWQTERYYGRVDQIPIYQGTIRSLSVAFDVVAWKPADLLVMWKKLEKLQSMVYPFYNTAGFINAGPIIRMRIGDLFAAKAIDGVGGRGLPGYITSMDWSYDDGIWNVETGFKVPRKVTVSLGFTVLHNGNPGTYPFQENTFPDDAALPSDADTDGIIFGAGKFTKSSNGVDLQVSRAEIRKIFDPVKGS